MSTLAEKFKNLIGIKTRPKMPQDTFQPNNVVRHRYEKTDILEQCLKGFGCDPKKWRINDRNRPGIQIQLPHNRILTDQEIKQIHEAYEAAHDAKEE